MFISERFSQPTYSNELVDFELVCVVILRCVLNIVSYLLSLISFRLKHKICSACNYL